VVFIVGVVLFALGILGSIALHECGHMWVARATGMKVRRYFVGFGPKIWSIRRGETEYGIKAIPAGGFCDIAGMTALEELSADEVDRAMYKQKVWKRVAVLLAGPAMNFVIGIVLIYIIAVGWGLPNLQEPPSNSVGRLFCVAPTVDDKGMPVPCSGAGPAELAGLRTGDIITAVDGVVTPSWTEVVAQTQSKTGVVQYSVEREGQPLTIPVAVLQAQRLVVEPGAEKNKVLKVVGAIGISPQNVYPPNTYNAVTAIPGTLSFTGEMGVKTVQAITELPSKVGALWSSITGGERDPDTPISVLGASVAGGQIAERGIWESFLLLLASLNLFLGLFNLLPLLPFDGGHIAIASFEKLRNMLRKGKGLGPAAPVNYLKLMPMTYVVLVLGGGYMLLTLVADIVNPIKLF
ncbi:MAG: M50 family metallopeptidase, partial [Mycobacteriaceae bacterium]